jgi:hypothetical protein
VTQSRPPRRQVLPPYRLVLLNDLRGQVGVQHRVPHLDPGRVRVDSDFTNEAKKDASLTSPVRRWCSSRAPLPKAYRRPFADPAWRTLRRGAAESAARPRLIQPYLIFLRMRVEYLWIQSAPLTLPPAPRAAAIGYRRERAGRASVSLPLTSVYLKR